ncbi:HIT family protein [Streptomyces sp. NPDC094438]|uniref:HIT family protein n=1 Tax=Streptomyces sp. NPDC094438 TaxID=3366061 RepID=UPI0038272541
MTPEPPADCPFCQILAGRAPANIITEWPDAIAIVPLRPCSSTHRLVIPRVHVKDVREDLDVTTATVRRAIELALGTGTDFQLIANTGPDAEQTVDHAHLHVIGREAGDGLNLWPQRNKQPTTEGSAAAWRRQQKAAR